MAKPVLDNFQKDTKRTLERAYEKAVASGDTSWAAYIKHQIDNEVWIVPKGYVK